MPLENTNINSKLYTKQEGLTNIQMELIKLYSTNLEHNDLMELKSLLAGYFSQKAIREADNIWNKKEMSDQIMDNWLNAS